MNEKDLFNQYVEKMESIKGDYFKKVNKDLLNGQNSYLRMRMKGSSFFNDEWINKIEDCIYELGQIVNNPLEVTKTEGNLTPIELAKKINYESIQHLASHTQFIKDVDEEGNVIPAKILAQFHKEELHTYENRFIATFIRRLVLFVEKRYEFIRSTVNFDTKDILYIKNKSVVDGQEVEIETKVTVKKENEDTESKIAKGFVERVEKMRTYVNYFYNSPFMKELKTEKDVRKPILQTNVIRKNPLYHKCYETFLFIERFSSLGVEYTLDENYQAFNEKERKELNYILASNLLSLGMSEKSRSYKQSKKVYKPKILPSIDDEIFTYGELLKGPIEFVRVDDKYIDYLKSRVSKDIPKKPTKHEKEYYKEEIEYKKNTELQEKDIALLLKRIRREIAKWEKIAASLVEERQAEEKIEAEKRLAELRKEENDILEKKRAAIIAAALEDKQNGVQDKPARKKAVKKAPTKKAVKKVEEEPKKEEPKPEPEPVKELEPAPVAEVVKPEPQPEPVKEPEPQPEPVKKVEKKPIKKAPAKKPAVKKEPAKKEEKPAATKKKPAAKKEAPKKEAKPAPEKPAEKVEKTAKSPVKPENSKKKSVKKAVKKPLKKEVKKEAPKEESKSDKPKNILEVIPGRFIVKTLRGYYVSDKEFSNLKSRANIFKDFNKARHIKEVYGGKVIKL